MSAPSSSNTYTMDDSEHILELDKTNNDVYVTIPSALGANVTPRYVKVLGNNANVARLTPNDGTIEGASYWQTTTHRKGITIVPGDGNDWLIVGSVN